MEQNGNKNVETAEATQVSHEETRKKLKKQRVRQIVASLIGVAILAFGLWKSYASSSIIALTKRAMMLR